MKTKKNIEVELRSLIDEKKFIELNDFLIKNGEDLGEDDKDSYFYHLPDKLIKVVNSETKNSAKLTLKLQKIGLGDDFEEIDVNFLPKDIDNVLRILEILGYGENHLYSYQNRHNYLYKGVEFAIKYTVSWGFHCEMEIVIDNKEDVSKTIKQIEEIALELGLKTMSNDESKEFMKKIITGWERGHYSRDEFKKLKFK